MGEWLLLGALLLLGSAALAWVRRREEKYLLKKTRDVLRPVVREELESERQDYERRKTAFQTQLQKFGRKSDEKDG